jgi:hypothetical protein
MWTDAPNRQVFRSAATESRSRRPTEPGKGLALDRDQPEVSKVLVFLAAGDWLVVAKSAMVTLQ